MFKKNITAAQIKNAKVGDTFVLEGHRVSATSVPFRAGFKFTTHMGFIVFKPSIPVYKVTVIKLKGIKNDH